MENNGMLWDMSNETRRMWARLPEERAAEIERLASGMGMSITAMSGMCIWIGFQVVRRIVEPEKVFTPEMWLEMGQLAVKQGLIDLPEDVNPESMTEEQAKALRFK